MTHIPYTKPTRPAMIGDVDLSRIGKLDVAFTVAVTAFAVYIATMYVAGTEIDGVHYEKGAIAIPLALLLGAPLLLRTVAPLHGLALGIAGVLVHYAAVGEMFRCGPIYLVAFLMAFSAALRLPLRHALLGLAMAIGLCMAMAATGDGATGLALQPAVLVLWGAGRLARSRTRMNEELEARTSALKAARDERARLEVSVDRARLSTELDELLKRRLADLARLAEAGAGGAATLAQIEHESRRTLDDMRDIVGVLRSDDGGAAVEPLPTLAHLEALLLRARGAGGRLNVSGDPRVLPAGVELSAYRVVEHLLEAMRDAPEVEVSIRFDHDTLGLTVSGATRRRDLGPAVERARERVQLHRGTLSTNSRDGRAEAVALLPVGAGV